MAVKTATNPKTGKTVALIGEEWVPIQTATHSETGDRIGLIDGEWQPIARRKYEAGVGAPVDGTPPAGIPAMLQMPESAQIPTAAPSLTLPVAGIDEAEAAARQGAVRPEALTGMEAYLNAMPEKARQAEMAKLQKLPSSSPYARAANVVAEKYKQYEAAKAVPSMRLYDPRLEAQTERFVEAGMKPEDARALAAQQAQAADYYGAQQVSPDVVGAEARAAAEQQTEALKGAGFLRRVGAEMKGQYTSAGLGFIQMMGDLSGSGQLTRQALNAGRIEDARQAAIPKGEGVFEKSAQQAMASLGVQAPTMALGVITGTATPVLAQAFLQSFGSEYNQGRQANQTPAKAAARASLMASAEVLFERYGLERQFGKLKKSLENVNTKDLSGALAKGFMEEIPAEQATSVAQFLVDKAPEIGLQPNATLDDFLENQAETLRQTLLQTHATVAGIHAIGKAAELTLPKEEKERRAAAQSAEQARQDALGAWGDFSKQFREAAKRGEERRAAAAARPEPTVDTSEASIAYNQVANKERRDAAIASYVRLGFPEDDAARLADRQLAKDDEQLFARAMEGTQVVHEGMPVPTEPTFGEMGAGTPLTKDEKEAVGDLIGKGMPPQQAIAYVRQMREEGEEAEEPKAQTAPEVPPEFRTPEFDSAVRGRADDLVKQGMTPNDALRTATQEMTTYAQMQEPTRGTVEPFKLLPSQAPGKGPQVDEEATRAQTTQVAGEPERAGLGAGAEAPVPTEQPAPTGGAVEPERSGVVRARKTLGEIAGAKGTGASALTTAPLPDIPASPEEITEALPKPTKAVLESRDNNPAIESATEFGPPVAPTLENRRAREDLSMDKKSSKNNGYSGGSAEDDITSPTRRQEHFDEIQYENAMPLFTTDLTRAVADTYPEPTLKNIGVVHHSLSNERWHGIHHNGGVTIRGSAGEGLDKHAYVIAHELGHAAHSLLGSIINKDPRVSAELPMIEHALYPGLRDKLLRAEGRYDNKFFNYLLSPEELIADFNVYRLGNPEMAAKVAPRLSQLLAAVDKHPDLVKKRHTFPNGLFSGAAKVHAFFDPNGKYVFDINSLSPYLQHVAYRYSDPAAQFGVEQSLPKAIAIMEAQPSDYRSEVSLAEMYGDLGDKLLREGDLRGAQKALTHAVELFDKVISQASNSFVAEVRTKRAEEIKQKLDEIAAQLKPASAKRVQKPRGRKPQPAEKQKQSEADKKLQRADRSRANTKLNQAIKRLEAFARDEITGAERAQAIAQLYALMRAWDTTKPTSIGTKARARLTQSDITDADRAQAKTDYEARRDALRAEGETPRTVPFWAVTPDPIIPASDDKTRKPSVTRTVRRLASKRKEGWISDDEFSDGVQEALETERKHLEKLTPKDLARGVARIKQRLWEAVHQGDIEESEVRLAEWLLDKNPNLVEDLAISITRPPEEGGFRGEYDAASRLVRYIKGATDDGTTVHEILHHTERMLPTDIQRAITKEWARQLNRARRNAKGAAQNEFFDKLYDFQFSNKKAYEKHELYREALDMIRRRQVPLDFYQYVNPSEFFAVNGTSIIQGRYDAISGGVLGRLKNWLREFGQKLRSLFKMNSNAPIIRAIDNLLKSTGEELSPSMLADFKTPAEARGQYKYAAIGNRTPTDLDRDLTRAEDLVAKSESGEDLRKGMGALQTIRSSGELRNEIRYVSKAMTYGARSAFVKGMTTDLLVHVADEQVPELRNTLKLVELLDGMTRQLAAGGVEMVEGMERQFSKKPELRKKIARLALESTITQYDPADSTHAYRNSTLDTRFNQLGVEGQRLYKEMRDYHERVLAYRMQLIDDMLQQLPVNSQSKQALRLHLAKFFQGAKTITPYFPLVRFGDHWVRVGSGPNRQFYMVESMIDRDRLAESLAKQKYPNLSKKDALEAAKVAGEIWTGNGSDLYEDRSHVQGSTLLPDIYNALNAANFVGLTQQDAQKLKNELADTFYQLYLDTLPEADIRTRFMHREDIAGFSLDISRATMKVAAQNAVNLAQLKYAQQLRNSISQAQDSIKERDELTPYVNEMKARVNSVLAPPNTGMAMEAAKWINRVTFVWCLSSASSALLQPTSVAITGFPVLASRFGTAATVAEMMRNLRFWKYLGVTKRNADGTISYRAPSIEHAKGLSPLEQRAVRAFLQRGTFQSTVAGEQYGYISMPSEKYDSPWVKFKNGLNTVFGGMMHVTERLSREFMTLTAFNLGYKKNLKANLAAGMTQQQAENAAFEAAIDDSISSTNEALMAPQQFNRPLGAQSAVGRVATMFKLYPAFIVAHLGLNFYKMLPLLNKEEKAEAAYKFFGTLGMLFVFSGLSGMPTAILAALEAMWKAFGDDDDELPDEMRNLSFRAWMRSVYLPNLMGDVKIGEHPLSDIIDRGLANALTGADVASRTGVNDVLYRDPQESATSREGLTNVLLGLAGPFPAIALRWADSWDAFSLGDYQRGFELAVPSLVRNPLVTARYVKEGVKTPAGAELLVPGALSNVELAAQVIGFRPDIVANPQDVAFMVNEARKKLEHQNKRLMDELKLAARKEDDDHFDEVIDKMDELRQKFPQYAPDIDSIGAALKEQEQQLATSVVGVRLSKQNLAWAYDHLERAYLRLEARNQKAIEDARKRLNDSELGKK